MSITVHRGDGTRASREDAWVEYSYRDTTAGWSKDTLYCATTGMYEVEVGENKKQEARRKERIGKLENTTDL